MKNEFLFQSPKIADGHLLTLRELESEMNEIISERIQRKFRDMDTMIVKIYDNRQPDTYSSPPLKSLGKMPLDVAIRKFR